MCRARTSIHVPRMDCGKHLLARPPWMPARIANFAMCAPPVLPARVPLHELTQVDLPTGAASLPLRLSTGPTPRHFCWRRKSFVILLAPAYANLIPSFTDRKSTRLNSSHLVISYAVFCLK